jgi:cytochrome c-type biogenesis protein CcmH/NrfF
MILWLGATAIATAGIVFAVRKFKRREVREDQLSEDFMKRYRNRGY